MTEVAKRGPGRPKKEPQPDLTAMMARLEALEAENENLKELVDEVNEASNIPAEQPLQENVDVNVGALQTLIDTVRETAPMRKVPLSEFKTKSSFRTDSKPPVKLTRDVYQHGFELYATNLFDEEIRLLNTLPAGRYLDNHVVVTLRDGTEGAKDTLTIDFPCKTHDQRLYNAQKFRTALELLQMCHAESQELVTA